MLLTEGQMSDHKGAVLLFSQLPQAKELLADKGYEKDAFNYFMEAAEKGRGFLERNRFLYEDGN